MFFLDLFCIECKFFCPNSQDNTMRKYRDLIGRDIHVTAVQPPLIVHITLHFATFWDVVGGYLCLFVDNILKHKGTVTWCNIESWYVIKNFMFVHLVNLWKIWV